jgi:hypothetical protein
MASLEYLNEKHLQALVQLRNNLVQVEAYGMDDCLSLPRGTTKKAIEKWEVNLACAPIDMKTPSIAHVESMDGGGFSIVKCKKTKGGP